MDSRNVLPILAMILLQFVSAGNNILGKVALDTGMHPNVMVAYRQIFATVILAPFAFFFERKKLSKLTKHTAFQLFLCSLFGGTLHQCFYFAGLKNSTPTIACALLNLSPAITFIIAIPFRMETICIKRLSGIAKVLATVVCVGGAMLMSFYKGSLINLGKSTLHWRFAEKIISEHNSAAGKSSSLIGPVFVFIAILCWSIWFIIQTKMNATFVAPYSTATIMCGMASIQCVLFGLYKDHTVAAWSLASTTRIVACLYSVSSLIIFIIIYQPSFYVSMFNPLALAVVAFLGWAILDEKLYVGSAVGTAMILLGLYVVLWSKHEEMKNQIVRTSDNENGRLHGGESGDVKKGNRDTELPEIRQPTIPNGIVNTD
ncbi:hypothetical protein MKW98_018451 [Papaver atlanticum]|uniref:WAT1-related protein n=1 Tax=Papaver atlanticum TaxID=357466 RepID=A0AAD4TG38_9MAGN|nr:hypothetical protein MKW98_018451 [Papaver atlanticum]